MRFDPVDPPRRFRAGALAEVEMSDTGRLALEPDEQVTFTTPAGGEYDLARKSWGFYATPSLNQRLPRFGLRACLATNPQGHRFVLLVEAGHEDAFEAYRLEQGLAVEWIDSVSLDAPLGCPCAGAHMEDAWTYLEAPAGETRFRALEGLSYRRTVRRCRACAHHTSDPGFDPAALYGGGYMDDTYRAGGITAAFQRIVALAPERSDNAGRVRRVVESVARDGERPPSALDVGSGLCVFLHGLAAHGWRCTALDPDPAAAAHARETVGVEAVAADFMHAHGLGCFDLVALNKVIEHVADPVAMLARAAAHLAPGGVVYCEVPDAPAAAAEGPGREEFFIEHLHAFSPASLAMAAARAGLSPVRMERLHEPSGKWTIAAFLVAT